MLPYVQELSAACRAASPVLVHSAKDVQLRLMQLYAATSQRTAPLGLLALLLVLLAFAPEIDWEHKALVLLVMAGAGALRWQRLTVMKKRLAAGQLRSDGIHDALILATALAWGSAPLLASPWLSGPALLGFGYACLVVQGGQAVSYASALPISLATLLLGVLPQALFFGVQGGRADWVFVGSAAVVVLAVCAVVLRWHALWLTTLQAEGQRQALIEQLQEHIRSIQRTESERDQALGFISHDLRAPQASILTLIELQRTQPERLPLDAVLARIEAQARQTLTLADGFLDLYQARAADLKLTPLDLVGLLQQLADELWAQATARQLRLVLDLAVDEAWVMAEPQLLRRAISNLLDNAIKHGPPGSELRCELRALGECWQLSISDQGPGIPEALHERIFEPFFRPSELTPQRRGYGLGLAFVRMVLQRHQGRVSLRSAPGQGSCFVLSLRQAELQG